jgi:hypothetical protein
MNLLERIKAANQENRAIRAELEKLQNYYSVPYEEMYEYYKILPTEQAEKFIEGWVATLIGGKKIESKEVPPEYKKNDNGDIWCGDQLCIGKNNIELKVSFRDDANVGGKQFRFYETVPYYMIFIGWDNKKYEMFLLTKQQLVDEIIHRAKTTTRSAFISSQGSGVISKMTQEQKIQRLLENVQGLHADKLTWEFNPRTEEELYKKFQKKYLVNPSAVKSIING